MRIKGIQYLRRWTTLVVFDMNEAEAVEENTCITIDRNYKTMTAIEKLLGGKTVKKICEKQVWTKKG